MISGKDHFLFFLKNLGYSKTGVAILGYPGV